MRHNNGTGLPIFMNEIIITIIMSPSRPFQKSNAFATSADAFLARPTNLCSFLAAAGGLATAHADIVQINVNHFYGTTTVPNVLNNDLTGDGIDDLDSWQLSTFANVVQTGPVTYRSSSGLRLVGGDSATQQAFASFRRKFSLGLTGGSSSDFWVGVRNKEDVGGDQIKSANAATLHGLMQVRFTDSRINGGAETKGYLHVRAMNFTPTQHHIDFLRLIYDDASTEYPTDAEWTDVFPTAEFPDPPGEDPVTDNTLRTRLEAELMTLIKQLKKTKAAIRKATTPSPRLKKKLRKLKKKIRQKRALVAAAG